MTTFDDGTAVPSEWQPDDYSYNEKKLLESTNIGQFGFGVNIPIGTDDQSSTPTNYNYNTDLLNLRWKHIDEYNGHVK